MTVYRPDNWVVLEIINDDTKIHKVLAGWRGSYASADHWKINSGIKSAKVDGDNLNFTGYSGSTYCCLLEDFAYSLTPLTHDVYEGWLKQLNEEGSIGAMRILTLDEVRTFNFNKE